LVARHGISYEWIISCPIFKCISNLLFSWVYMVVFFLDLTLFVADHACDQMQIRRYGCVWWWSWTYHRRQLPFNSNDLYHILCVIYQYFFDMRYISIMFMRDRPSELMNHFLVSWTRNTAYFAQHVYSLGPLSFYLQVVW
jgi:hypothetical protein